MSNFPEMEYKSAEQAIELPENGTSLTLLQAIYRSATLPLPTRMRAAMACLPHEHPRLGMSVNVPWSDELAVRLEQAMERSNQVLRNEPTKIIEHQTREEPRAQSQLSGPVGPVPDRRFRRA
jgi:hypothetical protein